MLLKPDLQVKSIIDVNINLLKKNNIKGIILDVDNTLIDLNENPIDGIENWVKDVKNNNINLCICSNSYNKTKIEKIANLLQLKYVKFSTKPLKRGLKKAKKILQIKDSKNIAEIGDQLFTDVLGSNRMGMYSILTQPINQEKDIISKIKRKIEQKILEKWRED